MHWIVTLLLALGSRAEVSPLRFEAGMQWTYRGHYRASAAGGLELLRDFPLEARYLALPETTEGERFVLLWLDFGEGTSRFGERETRLGARQWGTFLQLAPDLRLKTALLPRRYEHPVAIDMEFSPFPPPGAPFRPGTSVSHLRATKLGLFDFRGVWEWRVTEADSALRTELIAVDPPMFDVRLGAMQELIAYREAFEVNPATGVLTGYERFDRQHQRPPDEPETLWETDVRLQLTGAEVLPEERVEQLLQEFLAVRELLFAYGAEPETVGRAEVDALLEQLQDSPVHAIARDLLEPALLLGQRVSETALWYADDAASLEGAAAPLFTGTDLNGGTISLEAQRGKVVLLNFWASW